MKEMEHRNSLVSCGLAYLGDRKCVIYSPLGDLASHRIENLLKILSEEKHIRRLATLRTALKSGAALEQFKLSQWTGESLYELARASHVILTSQERRSQLAEERVVDHIDREIKEWEGLSNRVNHWDPIQDLMQEGDVICKEDDLSPSEFVVRYAELAF